MSITSCIFELSSFCFIFHNIIFDNLVILENSFFKYNYQETEDILNYNIWALILHFCKITVILRNLKGLLEKWWRLQKRKRHSFLKFLRCSISLPSFIVMVYLKMILDRESRRFLFPLCATLNEGVFFVENQFFFCAILCSFSWLNFQFRWKF